MNAGVILRENASLKGPNIIVFGSFDECGEQLGSDAFSASALRHINAYFSNSGIHLAAGDAAEGRPAQDRLGVARNQPAGGKMGCVPARPVGSGSLEGRVAGGDSLQVDLANMGPMGCDHWLNGECWRGVGHGEDYRVDAPRNERAGFMLH